MENKAVRKQVVKRAIKLKGKVSKDLIEKLLNSGFLPILCSSN